MLSLVWERRPTYNNNPTIAKSVFATYVKLAYYCLFAVCYGIAGSMAHLVMVNSNWTLHHIQQLWRPFGNKKCIHVVFPPCDTGNFEDLPLANRKNIIISVGQFRPEKDHPLQLRSFALFRKKYNQWDVKLVLLGSCRDTEDQSRVDELRHLATDLKISDSVEFVLNQPFSVLKQWLGRSRVGLHTMWNEHFGIGVVEMMSAGCITIAHRSGGPLTDIIRHGETGFLASTEDEYACSMNDIFSGRVPSEHAIQINARKTANRFSVEIFKESFKQRLLASNILMGL
jgi:alpha-1,2-mannosyltransferase